MQKITFFGIKGWEEEYLKRELGDMEVVFVAEKISLANVEMASGAQIISVLVASPVTKEMLDKLPEVKMITTRSTGFDHVDVAECKKRGIVVCNVPFYGENTVAEHAFALLLDLSRKVHQSIAQVKQDGFSNEGLTGFDLKGKTLGIIGLGHIGQHVARIANGFEMKVVAFDAFADKKLEKKLNVEFMSLEDLLKTADIITLHVPDNEHTHHMINSQNVSMIKKGAYLINTARGGIVETEALVKALEQGILAGAGLDVLEEETAIKEEAHLLSAGSTGQSDFKTMLENHVLMEKENVVITPHNAFNSKEALDRILETTVENVKGYLGGKAVNVIPN